MAIRASAILLSVVLITLGCATSNPNDVASPSLKQYEFSQLEKLMREKSRPIAIFLQADWCTFCKNMEQTTLNDYSIIKTLNSDYYFVSFNGESKDEILFRGRRYNYIPTGKNSGSHEIAKALGTVDGELTYPTFVILNPQYDITFQYNAFLRAEELKAVLHRDSSKS